MSKRYGLVAAVFALFLMVVAGGVSAQSIPPYAAIENGTLTIYGLGGSPIVVNNPPNHGISSIVWSPDGTKLAYILYNDQFQAQLMVTDAAGANPITLDTGGLESGFPISFTSDGRILYASPGVAPQSATDPYQPEVRFIRPEAGATPDPRGRINFGTGCGGGSPFPGDARYWTETGFGGNPLILEVVPEGILHSTTCGGGGLAVLDLETGEDKYLGGQGAPSQEGISTSDTIGRVKVSPNGKLVAAVKSVYVEPDLIQSLVLIDLATGETLDIPTAGQPDQLAWSPDSTLYYSTRTLARNLMTDLTPEQGQTLQTALGFLPEEIPAYTVEIHHLNPSTGEDTPIYAADAYAIGRLEVPAIDMLVFSQVANQEAWVQGLLDGTINPMNTPDVSQQNAAVPVTLHVYTANTEPPTAMIGQNVAQVTVQHSRQ